MKMAAGRETAARRYRIEKYLTEGGMGAIYLGKKMGSGGFQKEVVLKQLLPEYTSRPEFRDLFFREAKISATLDHANIVHVFDLVESDQSLFIVMEYVRGADLRTILRRARQRHRELSPAAAIHIALEILAGLSYAHTRRDRRGVSLDIIHRDVSPSNIICSVQGEAKLSDFGIAKASTHSSVFYRVRGKVGYMSPEQARNQPIDRRCDIYSLAVCLYESLSGERLFVGDLSTPADEIYGHPILPISQKREGLPPALDEVMARALAPDIGDRYQTAGQLADALRTVAHKTGLAFSAPELASHLREILGDDPERWLRVEATSATAEAPKIPAASIGLVGKEAASIGIVAGAAEDADPRLVLSPRAVSGSKDFDLDSMLNDEATRPGRSLAGDSSPVPRSDEATPRPLGAVPRGEARAPSAGRAGGAGGSGNGGGGPGDRRAHSPPPVWTRSSGPIPIITPPPERAAAPHAAPAKPVAPARSVPAPKPAVAVPPPARMTISGAAVAPAAPPPLPMPPRPTGSRLTTQRGIPAIPPPVPPPVPPRTATLPPPPPPMPASLAPVAGPRSPFGPEFEDATPPPPAVAPVPHVGSFDIDESPLDTRPNWPDGPLPSAGSRPFPGRSQKPMTYPAYVAPQAAPQAVPQFGSQAVPGVLGRPLSQPETMDFSGSATLPEKGSGPPRWLVLGGLALGLVGGAVLGYRATRGDMAEVAAIAEAPRPLRAAPGPAPGDLPPPDEAPAAKADGTGSGSLGLPILPPPVAGGGTRAGAGPGRAHPGKVVKGGTARRRAAGPAHKKPARRH